MAKKQFRPNLGPQKFFCGFYLYSTLDIVASYHHIQFQGKLRFQTQENMVKNFILGLI